MSATNANINIGARPTIEVGATPSVTEVIGGGPVEVDVGQGGPSVPSVSADDVGGSYEGSGYGEWGGSQEDVSYAGENAQAAESPTLTPQSSQAQQQQQQQRTQEDQRQSLENLSAQVRMALGSFMRPTRSQMNAGPDSSNGPVRFSNAPDMNRQPTQTDIEDAQRLVENDIPLNIETTRRDPISQEQIAEAEIADGLLGRDFGPKDDGGREERADRRREQARRNSQSKNAMLSRSLSEHRVKPSVFDRLAGMTERRKAQVSTDNAPIHRPDEQVRGIRKMISRRFGGNKVGARIYGKIVALPMLQLNEIGIGSNDIMAVVEQNSEMLDDLIRTSISEQDLMNFTTTRTMTLNEIVDLINSNEVYVFTAKPPDNRFEDCQRRKVRILTGEPRGIFLHPIMAAMYTADFDGDDMQVSLDSSLRNRAKDPMEHMVGVDGEQSLNTDFLWVSELIDGYEDGKTRSDYVREIMLHRWADVDSDEMTALVNSVLELSETAIEGTDMQAVAWGDVFRAARAFADRYSTNRSASNRLMTQVVQAIYQGMRNHGINHALHTMGEFVPRDELPKALNTADDAIYKVIDGMVMGAVPNNFQELKVMMNGFLGNVSGKSAPFRFTADVGKMMKLDTRLRIGQEYVIDPNNEEDMQDLLQKTVKFAYSERMAVDVKVAGKSMQFTETLRNNVINEVGFFDSVDENGTPIYDSYGQFLMAFAESYNRNAAIINESNLIWLSNMAISSKSNRKTVSPINNVSNGNISYSDLASPFIEVYGTYSFDRMFGKLVDYERVDPNGPQGRSRSKNKLERDWNWTYNRTWVKTRYANMSIRNFSVNNHIYMETKDRQKLADKMLMENEGNLDVVTRFIAAISDKRTSTASEFNTKITGRYDSEDGVRGHVSEMARGGKKTLVGMTREFLTDIRNADLEGTLLAPGYYAGIGSRDIPDDVRDAMTSLANELAQKGFGLRSGHAKGADQAFELGAGGNADIYLPTADFEDKVPISGRQHTYEDMSDDDKTAADESVARYHPVGKMLTDKHRASANGDFGYKAHRRNYFQVVGTNGMPDSAFIACYAKGDAGGTGEAIRIARDRGIPVFNAADYDDLTEWQNDMKHAADMALAGQLHRDVTADQMLHVDDAVMAINATGYEMFRELNMDSTASFLASEYGRKMIEYADNADVLAGIRAAMVFEWQTMHITRIADELRGMRKLDNPSTSRIMYLRNQAIFAMDELSDKSQVWKGIISEMKAGSNTDLSAFHQLQTTEGRSAANYWKAIDFWASPKMAEYRSQYSSLRDVIEDLDMPWPLKCDIITDVVRWQTQDYHVNNFEIAYQMEVGGDARYSLDSGATKASMQIYRDVESASTRYANRSLRNLREEVRKAAEHHRNTPGKLTNTIHRLATSPWDLTFVDDHMYADAILAVRDKTYAQSEKAKKHPWTNAVYSAMSMQRVGGYFNDVYRFDDRMLGLQQASQISPMDLMKILDDPNYNVMAYDDYGSVGYIDQHTLLGIDHDASEQEIWDWLIANPRLANVLRAGAACVSADNNGNGYLGARLSLDETISSFGDEGHDVMGHVKYLMRDHPVYAGLISLLNPAHGTSVRNERNRVPLVEDAICREIYNAANTSNEMAASRVLSNLGVTRLKLRTLLTSDYDKYMARMGFSWDKKTVGEAKQEADDIYDTLETHVAKYIAEVRENVPSGPMIENEIPEHAGIDVESLASFWDTVQELSGAKVGVSTGIEGSETYQFSYWVSRMGAKDHYADLEAIENLIYRQDDPTLFNGMWTNKGTLEVSVDENGIVTTNIEQLRQSKTYQNDEIVTMVPEGFDVPDRSTDSYGTPVPSLYSGMVSKRSNGAEKFNLKAMKAGLDGTDSVVKMKDKYLMESYGDGTSYPTMYLDVRDRLATTTANEGLQAARMELANMMMKQDNDMGYKDMSLANYMCIAEIMLIEDAEGGIILRSLEQISAGLRGRLGARVEEMTDQQVMKEIADIVNDTGEQGIGQSMVWNAAELLSSMRPKSSAGDAVTGIKFSSSVFKRNYDLLMQIERQTGVVALDPSKKAELHNRIVGKNLGDGIKGVEDVWRRSNIVRNYQAIAYAGDSDGGEDLTFDNIGPSSAVVIGDGFVSKSRIEEICDHSYETGTTVVVSREHVSQIPVEYAADMLPANEVGDMLIPMFDARLNGSEAKPFQPRFAIFQAPFSRYVVSVEDRLNVFELGDAQYKFTRSLLSRMKAHDGNSVKKTAMELFPNVFANDDYKNAQFSINLAKGDIVRSLICNPETPQCTIDYGLVEGAKGFNQRVHDVNSAIRRFKERIDLSEDQDAVLRGVDGVTAGDIVAWLDLTISRDNQPDQHVLAPFIPFQLHDSKTAPESFRVSDVNFVDNDGSQVYVDWKVEREINDGYAKYFDSSGGANKGMINLHDVIEDDMRLKNGIGIDAYCASASTDSRKIGTDKRIKTMISLMAIARMRGYNFAKADSAFPNESDKTIKDALLKGRVPMEIWQSAFDGFVKCPVTFHSDPKINAFVEYECRKIYDNGGNPSDYLANLFEDENGNEYNTHVMWEFECMFDNSLHYEDSLLRFLHIMNPSLCPNGIDDPTEETDFRLYRDGGDLASGFDKGILQMQVPYPDSEGDMYRMWSNVFVGMSFFGSDWSGNTRPNVKGASDMLDAENTLSYAGARQTKDKARKMAEWATAGFGTQPQQDGGAFGLE